MSDVTYRPDIPAGDLIDNLVADAFDTAAKTVQVQADALQRLASYDEVKARYGGDPRLAVQFTGQAGRLARAEVHRQLRAKNMSLRAIAAVTGVSPMTVNRDLAVPDGTTAERGTVSSGTSQPGATGDGISITADKEESLEDVADALRTDNEKRQSRIKEWVAEAGRLAVAYGRIDPPPTRDEAPGTYASLTDMLNRAAGTGRRLEVTK